MLRMLVATELSLLEENWEYLVTGTVATRIVRPDRLLKVYSPAQS